MNTDKRRKSGHLFHLCSSAFIGGFNFGCHSPPKQQIVAWNGPTDPINKVVAEINRNADQVPHPSRRWFI